jgi:predicted DNA-binding mobile mystery protein A
LQFNGLQMNTLSRALLIEQIDRKCAGIPVDDLLRVPDGGWLRTFRTAMNMSLRQLAARLGITRQSAQKLELREADGSITLRTLRDAAEVLDLQLVYALVPKDGSLAQLIERRAAELARELVQRSATTMSLEDQTISSQRLERVIGDKTRELVTAIPRFLWD